ncbi:hypothetical protein OIU34_17235 [Pararhizobium sp. BT-229]|uniref:hypothetical protein n=1 Tax=Pararhizobium sp. BT-229 TaxID=2986923 RepID=UPI0021F6F412|nr:hypothetical protein [Pararhizobium sp. BT-229]MCV9963646.1 hypothetical protein [Pararhizobium sp. BT-229]
MTEATALADLIHEFVLTVRDARVTIFCMSLISSLDISSLDVQPRRAFQPRRKASEPVVTSTGWDWMLREAAVGGSDVEKVIAAWNRRREASLKDRWPLILSRMKSFVHRRMYTVTLSEIDDVLLGTDKPFGGTDGRDSKHGFLHNATTPSPINLILHSLMERLGRIPFWQDFEAYLRQHPLVLLSSIAAYTGLPLEKFQGDWLDFDIGRALRFRLATAYNSFIRELHLRAALAERHGVFIYHHFLLDAEFKIDFTFRDIAIELYLVNENFKDDNDSGRKLRCFDVNPGRDVEVVSFKLRHDAKLYDKPWLIEDSDIERTADNLLSGKVTHPRKPVF